jgi:hypothetical protein
MPSRAYTAVRVTTGSQAPFVRGGKSRYQRVGTFLSVVEEF